MTNSYCEEKEPEIKTIYFRQKPDQIYRQFTVVNGLKDGYFLQYNLVGQKTKHYHYRQGVKHGNCKKWTLNNILIHDWNYHHGTLHGSYKSYTGSGILETEGKFSFGQKIGLFKRYSRQGKLRQQSNHYFTEDEEIRYYTSEYTDYQLCFSLDQDPVIDKQYTVVEAYDSQGNNEHYGFHGPYREYHHNGGIKKEFQYFKSAPVGDYLQYYPNGSLKIKCCFVGQDDGFQFKGKNTKIHGRYHEWNMNGELVNG